MNSTIEDKLHGTIMIECRGKSRATIKKKVKLLFMDLKTISKKLKTKFGNLIIIKI
jgi:hypothetical protein